MRGGVALLERGDLGQHLVDHGLREAHEFAVHRAAVISQEVEELVRALNSERYFAPDAERIVEDAFQLFLREQVHIHAHFQLHIAFFHCRS